MWLKRVEVGNTDKEVWLSNIYRIGNKELLTTTDKHLQSSDCSEVVAEACHWPSIQGPLSVPDHNVAALAALPCHRQHAAATAQIGQIHSTL